jgi:anti-sigma factor RsiW
MSCDWREKIAPYVDDELDATAQQEAAAHLAGCSECTAAVAEHLALKKAVRVAANKFAAPPELHATIYRQLHPHARVSPWWKWGMSLVSLALVVALGAALWPKRPAKDPMIAELIDQHVIALSSPNPIDIANSNRHVVKPWFQGKLPFTFNLPEIAGTPFTLIGGKLVYAQQSPGAELLYLAGQHKVSVFIFQGTDNGEPAPVKTRNLSFTSTRWQQGGLHFILLTDAQDEADPLVKMFQDANKTD